VTAFGSDGEQRTAARVRAGDFGSACVTRSPDGLEAATLERAVREAFPHREDIGFCVLRTPDPDQSAGRPRISPLRKASTKRRWSSRVSDP
jgi:hypothetical protein